MKNGKIFLLLACALAFGCAGPRVKGPADGAVYYFGPVKYFSADGLTPYGATESLVRREISAGGALIVETVTQPGRFPSLPTQTFVTRLARRGHGLVYSAADEERTFSGSLTFAGRDLAAWTYDITLAAGGTITGSGRLNNIGISTEKIMSGARPVRIVEDLRTISRAAYEVKLAGLLPAKEAK